MLIDDENQDVVAEAPIFAHKFEPQFAFIRVGLVKAYPREVNRFERGVALYQGKHIIVQDEIEARAPGFAMEPGRLRQASWLRRARGSTRFPPRYPQAGGGAAVEDHTLETGGGANAAPRQPGRAATRLEGPRPGAVGRCAPAGSTLGAHPVTQGRAPGPAWTARRRSNPRQRATELTKVRFTAKRRWRATRLCQ